MTDRDDRDTSELSERIRALWSGARAGAQRLAGDDERIHGYRVDQPVAARLRIAPGMRDLWSRFLLARMTWILVMAIVVTASAGGFLVLQKPVYKSEATVAVYPASGASSALQPFVMGTEKGVVSSGAVLSIASQSLLIPVERLQAGLSITVPVDSDLLVISYSDRNPQVAQSAAEAIAQAYVAYRTTVLGSTNAKTANSSSTQALQVEVVTDATLPTSPDTPNPLLTILVALILGLSLGIGLALILDWLDDGLRGAVDLQAQANSPVLAEIPAFDRTRRRAGDGLIIVGYPTSPIAGAYGDLRTRVLQIAAARHAKTLLVTSPGRERKTTVAANLAGALALSGRRVVLVSADLRGRGTHAIFGLENRIGVTSVVNGESRLADALARTDVSGLEVLSGGPASPDPSSVLQSRAFHLLIKRLRIDADLIVIDAPPALASADTAALAEAVDMILVVADAKLSTRADVRAAAQELGRVRDRLVGYVLDNVGRPVRLRAAPARVVKVEVPATTADITSQPAPDQEIELDSAGAAVEQPPEFDSAAAAPEQLPEPVVVAAGDSVAAHEMEVVNGNGDGGWSPEVLESTSSAAITEWIRADHNPWHDTAIGSRAAARNGAPKTQGKNKRRTNMGRNER